jgi:hypothetical protein
MFPQRTRKKKKKKARTQASQNQNQQRVLEEKSGLQEITEAPQEVREQEKTEQGEGLKGEEQDRQDVREKKPGLQSPEGFPQKVKIRKRRKKGRIEGLMGKASKHIKVILVSIIWFLVVLYVIYRFVSSDSLPGGP